MATLALAISKKVKVMKKKAKEVLELAEEIDELLSEVPSPRPAEAATKMKKVAKASPRRKEEKDAGATVAIGDIVFVKIVAEDNKMDNEIVPAKVSKVLPMPGSETRVQVAYMDTLAWHAVKDDILMKAKEKLKSHRRREDMDDFFVFTEASTRKYEGYKTDHRLWEVMTFEQARQKALMRTRAQPLLQ